METINRNIFVTGGAGYIGAHTCVELLDAGYSVTVYDNFCNSHPESLLRVQRITGKSINVIRGDIRDENLLVKSLLKSNSSAVIHFAGLKSVGDSVCKPLEYYDSNVLGTLCLLQAMQTTNIKRIVFSSSATVYGAPIFLPITEGHPLSATNPYGRTKLIIEDILRDVFRSDPEWCVSILRYFNPVGAHKSGLIGEDPLNTPNNLMPIIAQVANGQRDKLKIWGGDYDTPDGTGIRDYLHVVDLAKGHLKALENINRPQCVAVNLGTGKGSSVLDVIKTFEKVSGQVIAYEFCNRRPGDVSTCYANTNLATKIWNWKSNSKLEDMCRDTWTWIQANPFGYANK